MLGLFWLQGVIALGLSIGFLGAAFRIGAAPPAAQMGALALWLLAMLGEAIADAQLERFRRDPSQRGRVCRHGLWRYSRHPNYFFECLHWFAYAALAWGTPWLWVALLSPALMAFLLLRLSGIPLLEAHAIAQRPDYAEYVRTTSALIPWPPRPWRGARRPAPRA
jgi:steroid 5-alpha reductase family enzyme